jgi:hypothetical protein
MESVITESRGKIKKEMRNSCTNLILNYRGIQLECVLMSVACPVFEVAAFSSLHCANIAVAVLQNSRT